MKVIFLDFDGVVNNIIWNSEGTKCSYNFPSDGKVNDFQAVQWVSQFCELYNYSIIITSSWRNHSNCKDCLKQGGLRNKIKIIDCLPLDYDKQRSELIIEYLESHKDIDGYLIFDDEIDKGYTNELKDHLILCDEDGFHYKSFRIAEKYHKRLYEKE